MRRALAWGLALALGAGCGGGTDADAGADGPSTPDGGGVCCPRGTPSCDCTPLGGWAPSMDACDTFGSCDVAPVDFHDDVDERGCPIWRTTFTECCNCPDAGVDGGSSDAGPPTDGGADAGASCLDEGHAASERYPVGDGCNYCDCGADGASTCTARACAAAGPTCTYDGAERGYGERFAATDGCNECVCAASGLACTRRCSGLPEEGAILLESLDEACGDDATFTGRAVLDGLPRSDVTGAFAYERDRALYPETRPDTTIRLRLVYEGGFVVCRLPSPTQPAIDMEIVAEWITADGAFDEGLPAYLRRNNFGFVDSWTSVSSAPVGALDGAYTPDCLDPTGFSFAAEVDADGTARGSITKGCETDIALVVGSFEEAP